jgi:signal transduction histidine kinase
VIGLRIGVRTRLLLAAVGAVAIALAIGVAAFSLVLGQRLTDNARSLARAQAVEELASLEVVDGRLVVHKGLERQEGVGGPVWVFEGKRIVEQPTAPAELKAVAASLAGGPERTVRFGESVRLYALPVRNAGKRVGTVVAGVRLEPYRETATVALVGSVAFAAVILIGVALLAHWILGKALLPVSQMTDDAAAWSEHDLDRRFDRGKPYDELTRLAATLDTLLERLSASLRYEQRLTAELSHELRTPLARIAAESELALRRERTEGEYRESLEAVYRNAEQMTRAVEGLLAAARQESGATRTASDARAGVRAAVAAVAEEAERERVEIDTELPGEPVPVAVPQDLLERILHPLLENAVRYGRSEAVVRLFVEGSSAFVDVDDDGAGLEQGEAGSVFDPGVRGTAAVAERRGVGLGLALSLRLARSVGGDVVAQPAGEGGCFRVRLPLA